LGWQTVGLSEVGDLPGLLLGLELFVAGADRGLVETFAFLERADVFSDLLPLVQELRIGLDQADELLTADLEPLRVLARILGDQLKGVVVVDEGGGEEDDLEVELVACEAGWSAVRTGGTELLLEALGGFEVHATEGAALILGESLLDLPPLLVG